MFLLFDFQEAEKFKAMVDSLQKVLLQRCDKEGKTVQTFKFICTLRSLISMVRTLFTWPSVRVELL